MSKKSINFDDKKISKSNFYKNKRQFKIDDIDVNKVLAYKKEPYSTKKSTKYLSIKCLLRSVIKNCKKSAPKYGEGLAA